MSPWLERTSLEEVVRDLHKEQMHNTGCMGEGSRDSARHPEASSQQRVTVQAREAEAGTVTRGGRSWEEAAQWRSRGEGGNQK